MQGKSRVMAAVAAGALTVALGAGAARCAIAPQEGAQDSPQEQEQPAAAGADAATGKAASGDGDARTLACDLLTQAYTPQKVRGGAFSVTGTDDRLSEALGADAAAIEEAVAGKAAEVSPQAAGASWDKEVWLDYAGNVASTTFTLDDPASTVVTVVSRGGSLEAM